jgi:hypothetical protein
MPLRVGNLLFPLADRPENYPSLISNVDLQSLMVHRFADAVQTCSMAWIDAVRGWGRMAGVPWGWRIGEDAG